MNIKLTGCFDTYDGYGYIGENLALSLDKLGHNVWVNPIKIWYRKESLKERTIQLMEPIKPDFELIVMYPTYEFQGIHKNAAIMTMYEAHKCPDAWVKRLNSLKLPIIAPSKFVSAMFRDSGVTVPISHLNLGIDTEFYAKKLRSFPKDRPFRFLTIGKMEPRKNVDCLVHCFEEAFPNDESVELIIKTRERFLPSSVRQAVQKDKRIKIIEKTISEEELRKLYYYCDAFVYPSRGEGFAFPPRNAVATGMPTMVTDWSALAEIAGAIKIATTDTSPMPPCGFSYGEHDKLYMANIDELDFTFMLQDIATDKKCFDVAANRAVKDTQDTWEDCAKNLVNHIEKQGKG
jgi:glycosyltransferase involved in cell wall biosynthesis